jgi:hypothetical protein
MSPTLVGVALSTNLTTGSASITANYPAASNPGDYIIVVVQFLETTTTAYTIATPTGWTQIPNTFQTNVATDGISGVAFGAVRGSETSVTITASLGGLYSTAMAFAFAGRTVNATNPVNIAGSSYTLAAGTTCGTPSVTTTVANCAVLCVSFSLVTSSSTSFTYTWTAPPVSQLSTVQHGSGSNAEFGDTAALFTQLAPAATAATTCTSSVSTQARFGVTIAVAPALLNALLAIQAVRRPAYF